MAHTMKIEGWTQGKDWDFAYQPRKWDDMIGEIPEYTELTFYDEELAMMFLLKYGSDRL